MPRRPRPRLPSSCGSSSSPGRGPIFALDRDSSSPAVNDIIGGTLFFGRNSSAAQYQYGTIDVELNNITAGIEKSTVRLIGAHSGNGIAFGSFSSNASLIQYGVAGTDTSTLKLLPFGFGQGERTDIAFFATFENTPGDPGPRRAADIYAGYNGGNWGAEYMAFGVGNNSVTNDAKVLTSEKMRIISTGNVGIGTSNPTSKLHVDGTSYFSGLTSFAGDISLVTGADQYMYYDGALHITKNGTGDALYIDSSLDVYQLKGFAAPKYTLGSYIDGDSGFYPPYLVFQRRGTNGNRRTPNTISAGTLLWDGLNTSNAYASFAEIRVETGINSKDGPPSSMIFSTSPGTSNTYAEAMRIDGLGRVGIGTASPNAATILDLTSTARGFLPPRMTTTQRDAISGPPAGLMIYNSTVDAIQYFRASGVWANT